MIGHVYVCAFCTRGTLRSPLERSWGDYRRGNHALNVSGCRGPQLFLDQLQQHFRTGELLAVGSAGTKTGPSSPST